MNSWAGNALWSEESCLAGGLHAAGLSDDEQRLKVAEDDSLSGSQVSLCEACQLIIMDC